MLSTVTDIVKFYGESIRQQTEAAARKGTPIGEDLAKHVKSYSALVATKARLEQTVMKSRPVGPNEDRSFDELADRAHNYLSENGLGEKMIVAGQKFLMRIEKKCVALEQDSSGEWVEAPSQRPGRRETNTKTDVESPID